MRLDEGGLSHKHMKAVAHEISQIPHEHERHATARHFEKIFASDNPRFDRYRFHQAAAGHPETGRDHPRTIRGVRGGFTRRHFEKSAAALRANPEARKAVAGHAERIHGIMNPSFNVAGFRRGVGIEESGPPGPTKKDKVAWEFKKDVEKHDRAMWKDRARSRHLKDEELSCDADVLITRALQGGQS
jgi:hypothetical protein